MQTLTYPEFSKLDSSVPSTFSTETPKECKTPQTLREMSEHVNLQCSLDGVPLDIVAARRPVGEAPVNRWKEASPRVPPRFPPLQHQSPPDSAATIPILPSTANVAWPPSRNPTSRNHNSPFHTPKPAPSRLPLPSCPGTIVPSAPGTKFVPQYTPAGLGMITEGLAPLPTSPLPEDQYELTEWEDSDAEKDDRGCAYEKPVPAWCIGWVDLAKTQTSIDPDTVFGTKLAKCDLDVLFGKDNAYLKARRGKRGSSGEWGMDNVSRQELMEYRQIMGQTQQLDSVILTTIAQINP